MAVQVVLLVQLSSLVRLGSCTLVDTMCAGPSAGACKGAWRAADAGAGNAAAGVGRPAARRAAD